MRSSLPPTSRRGRRSSTTARATRSRLMRWSGLGFKKTSEPAGMCEERRHWRPSRTTTPTVAERWIGSIRRECLNHFIILNTLRLKRTLAAYFCYYHRSRPHSALDKQCPVERQVMQDGAIIAVAELGGLHHRCERIAAWGRARMAYWRSHNKEARGQDASHLMFSTRSARAGRSQRHP